MRYRRPVRSFDGHGQRVAIDVRIIAGRIDTPERSPVTKFDTLASSLAHSSGAGEKTRRSRGPVTQRQRATGATRTDRPAAITKLARVITVKFSRLTSRFYARRRKIPRSRVSLRHWEYGNINELRCLSYDKKSLVTCLLF